jgi:hypothetical protein
MFFFHHAPELLRILMNASSVTARVLSLAVLLLSLAPLGSIYVLFFSVGLGIGNGPYYYYEGSGRGSGSSGSDNNSGMVYDDSLASVLKNPNVTLDELWAALFHAHNLGPHLLPANKAVLAALNSNNNHNDPAFFLLPMTAQSMHHLRLLLPWILSFVLGVLVPCLLSILALIRRRRQQRQRTRQPMRHQRGRSAEWNPARQKQALKQLTQSLELYTKTLQEEDRVIDDDQNDESSATVVEPSLQRWILPEPAAMAKGNNNDDNDNADYDAMDKTTTNTIGDSRRRIVTGFCGICLDSFLVQQTVTWSSNPACVHCFHDTCIQSWLFKTYRSKFAKNQCPCCRQAFLLHVAPLPTSTKS